MKTITQARLKEVLVYSAADGTFTWRSEARTGKHAAFVLHRAGDVVSNAGHPYPRVTIDGERHYLHRLAWLYMKGQWPNEEIDHRDGDKTNARWKNLRAATSLINKQNARRPRSDNKSGHLGVSWDSERKKWTARIKVDGKYKGLGRFADVEMAAKAYINAKRQLHAGCTI